MPKVVILGGGVAGMSAAHELILRGFEVEVYERNTDYAGGKARSVNVPGTDIAPTNRFLPGEHGFRFFPGFYRHITDIMKNIPFDDSGKTCFDNLVATDDVQISQVGTLPIVMPVNFPTSLRDIENLFASYLQVSAELTQAEVSFFSQRIWQLMTSCQDRFFNEYEQVGWWEYLQADAFSGAYRSLLAEGLTRSLVAAKAQKASTRTVGAVFLQLLYLIVDPFAKGTDRVLSGPTNDAWLNPWLSFLQSQGVKYYKSRQVAAIHMDKGKVSGVSVKDPDGSQAVQLVTGDYYLLATPVEVAANLISEEMLAADASLENIIHLAPNVEWMNGIQFYLTERFDMHRGHTIYSGSNWALTSVSQLQFWDGYDIGNRFNGQVKGILSVDISDWNAPGNFNQKAAQDCTPDEVKEEVWKQLKQEINLPGQPELLKDSMLQFVYLDADITRITEEPSLLVKARLTEKKVDKLRQLANKEPLLVNQVNTWTLRPNTFTQISNFFLAADYVKTYTDLATMEGASEAARRAVNNIITASGSRADYCELWKFKTPLILEALQVADQARWNKGLAWKNPL